MRLLFVFLFFCFFMFSCKNKSARKPVETITFTDTTNVIAPSKDSILLKLTSEVLTAFKNKDYNVLAELVHPVIGVRFSPYAYIDTAHDKILTVDMMRKQADPKNQDKILWGTIDPTDEPINRTIDDYVKEFVYDVDFLHPEKQKVNHFIGSGTTQNNLLAVYEGADFTESHFSGFDKQYEGMDWRSLRLVFKLKDGKYFLVGVVHDEWTT